MLSRQLWIVVSWSGQLPVPELAAELIADTADVVLDWAAARLATARTMAEV